MGKLRNNQSGFGAVEGILVLVIVVLIGVVGFMVYKNHNKTKPTPVASTTTTKPTASTQAKTPTAPDPYTGWQTYTGTDVNFKYPADWTATAANFGEDRAVFGTAVSINPNTVPTNTGAFVNPPASYSKSNSYTVTIKELFISTSEYLSYLKGPNQSGIGGVWYNQPTPYNYLKTSGQVTSGLFSGKYLTFLSQLNTIKNVTNKLPTQGLVTNQSYDGSSGTITEQGFVVANGKTYQITVDSTDDSAGNGYPSVFNMSGYTGTDLYKDTVLLLNSVQ